MLAIAGTPDAIREAWRQYVRHSAKLGNPIKYDLPAFGSRIRSEWAGARDAHAKLVADLDDLKMMGLYVDCVGKRQWSEPSTEVTEEAARLLVAEVVRLSETSEVPLREMELWVEHVSSPISAEIEWAKGYTQWLVAMEASGLLQRLIPEIVDQMIAELQDSKLPAEEGEGSSE